MALYQVCWKSPATGAIVCGDPVPRYLADYLAKYEDRVEPDARHYIQECDKTGHALLH